MLKSKNVKIKYFSIYKEYWNNYAEEDRAGKKFPFKELPEVLDFIVKKVSRGKRRYELGKAEKKVIVDKFQSIENSSSDELVYFGTLISADSGYRPPLVDRDTFTERDNPKKRSEGDKETTYFTLKVTEEEVYFFLQGNSRGVTIKQIIELFQYYTKKIYLNKGNGGKQFSLKYSTILKDDFLREVNRMGRIKGFRIFADKRLLGSNFLNYSNRIFSVKDTINIFVGAERGLNIKNCLIDVFNLLNTGGTSGSIRRIKAEGFDEFGASSILDTEKMAKIETIEADLNLNTGEISYTTFKSAMIELTKSF